MNTVETPYDVTARARKPARQWERIEGDSDIGQSKALHFRKFMAKCTLSPHRAWSKRRYIGCRCKTSREEHEQRDAVLDVVSFLHVWGAAGKVLR